MMKYFVDYIVSGNEWKLIFTFKVFRLCKEIVEQRIIHFWIDVPFIRSYSYFIHSSINIFGT